MTKEEIFAKIRWAIVLVIGLTIIFGGYYVIPPELATVPDTKSTQIVVQEVSSKDWTDYVDKIVGWIVSLAATYKLFERKEGPK